MSRQLQRKEFIRFILHGISCFYPSRDVPFLLSLFAVFPRLYWVFPLKFSTVLGASSQGRTAFLVNFLPTVSHIPAHLLFWSSKYDGVSTALVLQCHLISLLRVVDSFFHNLNIYEIPAG